jgi:hypothetical protein
MQAKKRKVNSEIREGKGDCGRHGFQPHGSWSAGTHVEAGLRTGVAKEGGAAASRAANH